MWHEWQANLYLSLARLSATLLDASSPALRAAADGMRFTGGYAPAPICSASRASILTGKTPARLGFEFVTKNTSGHQAIDTDLPLKTPTITLSLPTSEVTIAERLAAVGYQTAFFGKWHISQHYEQRYLAWHPEFGPQKQGFAVATEDFGDHPYAWKNSQTPKDLPPGVFPTDSMIDRSAAFIRDQQDSVTPFFLMASSFYVHTPVKNRCRWLVQEYQQYLPADARNRDQRLEYAAFVETLDQHERDGYYQAPKRRTALAVVLCARDCSETPLASARCRNV